jgi:acetyl-CoA carboxylase carboxyltransferase component
LVFLLSKYVNYKWKERIASAIREFGLDKYSNSNTPGSLPTAEELRAALSATGASLAREAIASLYDADTFVETGAFVKRNFCDYLEDEKGGEFESVITGYGAVDGKLVFTYAFDSSRRRGAVDDRTAAKIVALYDAALKSGAPVVAIFDSIGADIFEGMSSLSAYAKIMRAVADASGVVPQIAYVLGNCSGSLATVAAMCDTVVKAEGASLYVTAPALTGAEDAQSPLLSYTGEKTACAAYLRSLLSFLPPCSGAGVCVEDCRDDLNRLLGNVTFGGSAEVAIGAVADCGSFIKVGQADAFVAAFATVGGVRCGVLASDTAKDGGRIDACSARMASRFVDLCDAFSLPVVTLVDSMGLAVSAENEKSPFSAELAKLAFAYAGASVPTVTVVIGNAIGASAVLLGSKSLGADIAYAVDTAEIGALAADAGVAFAWEKHIANGKTREELADEWRASVASPVAAASTGEIDDIIGITELRARIASALLMLSTKGTVDYPYRAIRPL